MKEISRELLGLDWVEPLEDSNKYLKNYIQFWFRMGYDYVRFGTNAGFIGGKGRETDDTAYLSRG